MCKYCERKPIFSNGYHMYYENETNLGEPEYAALCIGVDENGQIYLAALGDDRVIWYPNFCPVCGRQLNHPEYSNIKEERKTYFEKNAYTYEGPSPSIHYQ